MYFDKLADRRYTRLVVALLILSALAAVFIFNLKNSYDEKWAVADRDNQNLALVLEQHIAAVIRKTDLVLDHLTDELEHEDEKDFSSPQKTNLYLKKLLEALPESSSLRFIGADGKVIADASGDISPVWLGDRSYFVQQRDTQDRGLFISEAIQSRILPGWFIILSRRVEQHGKFAGVVTAAVSLSYLEHFFGSLNRGKSSSIALISKDMQALARTPASEEWRGKSLRGGDFERAVSRAPQSGVYVGVSTQDGEERLYAYRGVENLPLYVNIGQSPHDFLAEWRNNSLVSGAMMLFLIAAIAALTYEMNRRYAREEENSRKLRAASFYARNLIEASLDPLVTISPEGKITGVNQATEIITGVPRNKLLDSDFCDYFTAPDKAREGYLRVFQEGLVRDWPLAIRHASGRIIDVLYNATVYRDEGGAVQGVFAAARDVTERLRNERMREFENHALSIATGNPPLSATLEILCRGIDEILTGSYCAVFLLNEEKRQLNVGSAPRLPEGYIQAIDGLAPGPATCSCGVAAATGRQIVSPDIASDPHWEKFRPTALAHGLQACCSIPIYSAGGDIFGTFSVYWDTPYTPKPFDLQVVSRAAHLASIAIQRKQADEALKHLNETLEQRVSEEVGKNMEQERMLIQQSRLAAMGEMIGNIAHQWRQPLNALGLLLANIKDAYEFDELDDQAIDHSVKTGRMLIQKMSTTIDDFRNFFRPNKEKVAFSLKKPLTDTLDILSASLRNHNIQVEIDAPEDLIADGFPNEYSQVLLNILNNAKDALISNAVTQGRITVRITREGALAKLSVRDNAGGIPAAILPKIFDPYFTTKEKGTGIGLYMSKMIIEDNMNGRIEAHNVDDGAEFSIVCPLAATGADKAG